MRAPGPRWRGPRRPAAGPRTAAPPAPPRRCLVAARRHSLAGRGSQPRATVCGPGLLCHTGEQPTVSVLTWTGAWWGAPTCSAPHTHEHRARRESGLQALLATHGQRACARCMTHGKAAAPRGLSSAATAPGRAPLPGSASRPRGGVGPAPPASARICSSARAPWPAPPCAGPAARLCARGDVTAAAAPACAGTCARISRSACARAPCRLTGGHGSASMHAQTGRHPSQGPSAWGQACASQRRPHHASSLR